MTFLTLFFILFSICQISIAEVTKPKQIHECFVVSQNVQFDQQTTTLTINALGNMCDCRDSDLEQYKSTVTNLVFSNTVTSIGKKCFSSFQKVKKIEFGSSLEIIDSFAFYATHVEELVFPESVIRINDNAFNGNKQLKSIVFAKSTD